MKKWTYKQKMENDMKLLSELKDNYEQMKVIIPGKTLNDISKILIIERQECHENNYCC